MDDKELPFVSIVMPIRNEADFIERTLNSVLGNDYPSEKMEVLVADGSSDDGTQEIVRRIGEKDSRVKLLQNAGKIVSTGLNIALRKSKGEVFIRIDGHCEIGKDFIRKSINCLQEHSEAWVCGGYWKTISQGYIGKAIATATQTPIGVGNAKHRLGNFDGWVDTLPYGVHHHWVVEKIGYFDEELVRNQDDEFNLRVRLAGGKIWLSSSIWSIYYSRSSLKKLWRQYFQYGFWRIRTLQKHKRPATVRQVIPIFFLLSIITFAVGGFVLDIFWWALLAELSIYLLVQILGIFSVGRKSGWQYAPAAVIVFAILHFGYGLGGLWGIVRFILLRRKWMKPPTEFKLSR